MKKFSIIIPCYNSFNLMGRCLESLEKQTDKDFEVIIIDDCSKDNSYQKLLEYKNNSNLDIIVEENSSNLGPGETRNNGIELSNGEYIFMVDSDDYIAENTVEELKKVVNEKKADCILFNYYIDKNNKLYPGNVIDISTDEKINKSDALVYSSGATWCKVYKTKIIKENKIKYPNLKRNEDMPFNKIAISYCNTFAYLEEKLYYYVIHNQSLMHNQSLLDENNAIKAFEYISNEIRNRFPVETEAIFIKECLYGTTMTLVHKKFKNKEIKQHINKLNQKYPNWDKNEKIINYPKHIKLCLKLIKRKNILLLRLVEVFRNILKK